MSLTYPPILENSDGETRTVGLELEFAGLELRQIAEIIKQTYGGHIAEHNRYEFEITETGLGDFRVELDARILRKMAGQNIFKKWGFDFDEQTIRDSIEELVDKMAKSVVPVEVVMPPVPFDQLKGMEKLRKQLQQQKAEGTGTSLVHAFGMHINIESPDLETPTLLAYLRAFLLVYPWLLKKLNIDISRRISPFVDPFPDPYVERVLNLEYQPDRDQFVEDYLRFNATRNRPLDMMPIFAMLKPDRIARELEGEKNSPRPTFHYRLPNSHIDDPTWEFSDEWNYWCAVEKLAADREMISKLSRLYVLRKGKTLVSFKKEWIETITILLDLDEKV